MGNVVPDKPALLYRLNYLLGFFEAFITGGNGILNLRGRLAQGLGNLLQIGKSSIQGLPDLTLLQLGGYLTDVRKSNS